MYHTEFSQTLSYRAVKNLTQCNQPVTLDYTAQALVQPIELKTKYALSDRTKENIIKHRQDIENILNGQDKRFLLVVGPCSIHDAKAMLEYAECLKILASKYQQQLKIVMRAYIEKPRSTVGWKGYVYDPSLENAEQKHLQNLASGLQLSRQLLVQLAEMDLPLATEVLNPMLSHYFDDIYSWGAIGARTSESQIHREIASLLPYAIGFKNGTDGNVKIALDAIQSARQPHDFLGVNEYGQMAMHSSIGNRCGHLILRGGQHSTNFDQESILAIQQQSKATAIVVDCSHGNSQKIAKNQITALQKVIDERAITGIKGVMLESHLRHGKQNIDAQPLIYGCSITDECIGWEETVDCIEYCAKHL
ncbi:MULTISPECIES: 3-deoxy-7-phosphoheptulonate synthase [unclassified Acinetobacter]|uniref:3-deoxy-7-phosphoheptulonate synthase n=1 Tax=unclassified Acinetobacter TaxID=196816 RepID=UPI0035B87487